MSVVAIPDYMTAFDGEWSYYVHGHDVDELHVIDDPEELEWEALWMRPVRCSDAENYGVALDDDETVQRNPATGRFEAIYFWLECGPGHRAAVPFLGCKYKPE